MKDKNGQEFDFLDEVQVPSPNRSETHKTAFIGYILEDFHKDFVVVEDEDGNRFNLKPKRLEILRTEEERWDGQ